ncbi:hypothetical protein TSUD_207010 [Trifolium subterraneum]|uniref:Uncharacterized protein n=1 Tax=Trifolium subterraneum TaxID=3900 RepID=A0A2Z6NNN6_TRISU|nr:hypothetical protein TSUD_207010 [Trifolium subterraneum]
MDSILSLDDGRWSHPIDESCSPVVTESREDYLQLLNIKQPLPPPVLAQIQGQDRRNLLMILDMVPLHINTYTFL